MKMKWLYLVAAVALVISISAVRPALAYFTATDTVKGTTKAIHIVDTPPELDEQVDGMTKKITIKNTGDYDIFVRSKAISPDIWKVVFSIQEGDNVDWFEKDGYYYYSKPIAPGKSTESQLILDIVPNDEITAEYEVPDSFNVVIVQEATKAYYDENGNAIPDDWANAISNQINVGR